MKQVEKFKSDAVPVEKTIKISEEMFSLLTSKKGITMGKSEAFGGYIVSSKKRKERKKIQKVVPKFIPQASESSKSLSTYFTPKKG